MSEKNATPLDLDALRGHTAGPWTARMQRNRYHDALGWIIEHNNGRIGWSSVAYADTNSEADKTDPANEANARLIAAAPQLLSELLAYRARDAAVAELVAALESFDAAIDFALQDRVDGVVRHAGLAGLKIARDQAQLALSSFRQGAVRED